MQSSTRSGVTVHGPHNRTSRPKNPGGRRRIARRGGQIVRRDVVIHPGAVAILPLLDAEHVCLLRNHRPSVDETLWEIPAGTLEPGEPIEQAAVRELAEETGYRAGRWRKIHSFFPSPGVMDERTHLFVAENLTAGEMHLEADETIEPQIVPWQQAFAWCLDGTIRDAKTLVAHAAVEPAAQSRVIRVDLGGPWRLFGRIGKRRVDRARRGAVGEQENTGELRRHFGVWQATALNVAMIVGAGVFITIPPMLVVSARAIRCCSAGYSPAALILADGLVWSELGGGIARLGRLLSLSAGVLRPGRLGAAGGLSVHLAISAVRAAGTGVGADRHGRLLAVAQPGLGETQRPSLVAAGIVARGKPGPDLQPGTAGVRRRRCADRCAAVQPRDDAGPAHPGVLHRRTGPHRLDRCRGLAAIRSGRGLRLSPRSKPSGEWNFDVGAAMRLAMYSYLGYYNICYLGDEVRNPGRTIPPPCCSVRLW